MLLVLCLQVVFQAPQHFRSSETETTCDGFLSFSLSLSLSIYIYIYPCAAPTCVVLLQAAYTFCVSVLYVHLVFDDKHVLIIMCVRACMCLPQIKQIYIYILCSLSTCFSVYWCPFQHGLYECTYIL